MKNCTIVTIILLFAWNISQAQSKLDKVMQETTPEQRAEMQTQNMTEVLKLTEEQKPLVAQINLTYAKRMDNVYRSGGSRLQKLKAMKQVSQDKDAELRLQLTKEQYAIYERRKEEMREKAKENRKKSGN